MQKTQKTLAKLLILTIAFTFALSVNYLFAAWVGPTQAPPGGNTPAPVHVGLITQTKDGGLIVGALRSLLDVYVDGKVGIGTTNPSEALEVAGNIKATQGLQVGNTTNANAGTIRWSGSDFEGYDGSQWKSLTASSIAISSGQQTFTNSGTFTVPDGVTKVSISMSGGGGGGNGYYSSGNTGSASAKDGGNSSFGNYLTTQGGKAGGKAGGTGGQDGISGFPPNGLNGGAGGAGGGGLFGTGGVGGAGGIIAAGESTPGGKGGNASGYGAGGGGGGGFAATPSYYDYEGDYGYGGGGAAAAVNGQNITVTSGENISVIVGKGGNGTNFYLEYKSGGDGSPGFVTVAW
jgi:hypothetical protein